MNEEIKIEVVSSNKKLNELYNKHGFEYVRDGQDSWTYTLREYKIK